MCGFGIPSPQSASPIASPSPALISVIAPR